MINLIANSIIYLTKLCWVSIVNFMVKYWHLQLGDFIGKLGNVLPTTLDAAP